MLLAVWVEIVAENEGVLDEGIIYSMVVFWDEENRKSHGEYAMGVGRDVEVMVRLIVVLILAATVEFENLVG